MKYLLIAAAAALMAACQPMPADGGRTDLAEAAPAVRSPVVQSPAAPSVAGTEDAAACAAAGGKMLPQGRMQTVRCVITYADAGQRCTDGDQCAGDCRIADLANTPSTGASAVGQCQANSSAFGCYTTVEGGKAEATICVD
jgi:putative hemolysin